MTIRPSVCLSVLNMALTLHSTEGAATIFYYGIRMGAYRLDALGDTCYKQQGESMWMWLTITIHQDGEVWRGLQWVNVAVKI